MASVREQAVALLNDAKLQADSSSKVDHLKQLMELVLYRDPDLLGEFVPHLLEFQSEPGWFLRKYLAEMVELVGMKFLKHVPVMVPTLLVLLRDSAAAVVQRAIITGTHLFSYTFEQLVLQGIYSRQVEKWLVEAWAGMLKVKEAVFPTASQDGNDVIRLHAIKFVESAILLFTPDPNSSARPSLQAEGASKECNVAWISGGHPILGASELGQEASRSLGLLLGQLRAPEVSSLPGPVAIVLLNSLGNIAKKRPTLFGRILPVLIALGPNCEAIKGSQVTSVIHTLRTNLLGLLKCTHPGAAPWRERLLGALRAMNAGESAEAALRQVGRVLRGADREPGGAVERRPAAAAAKDERLQVSASLFINSTDAGRKRAMVHENGNQAGDVEDLVKRLRPNPSAAAAAAMSSYASHLQSEGQRRVLGLNGKGAAAGAVSLQQQINSMIGDMVSQGGQYETTVDVLIGSIPLEVLVDIVVANMIYLPTRPPAQSLSSGADSGYSVDGPAATAGLRLQHPSSHFVVDGRPQHLESRLQPDLRRDPRRGLVPGAGPSLEKDAGIVAGAVGVGAEPVVKIERADLVKIEEPTYPGSRDPRGAGRGQASQLPTAKFRSMPIKVEPVDSAPQAQGNEDGGFSAMGLYAELSKPPLVISAPSAPSSNILRLEDLTTALSAAKEGQRSVATSVPGPIPVLPLHVEQQSGLCKRAVMRILECHKAVEAAGRGDLRMATLARLVSQSREDGVLDVFRKYLLADYHGHKGHELALHVLYQLYVGQAFDSDSPPNLLEIHPAYESFLLLLAEGLKDILPPSDKSLSRLFAESPVLPGSALRLLEGICTPSSQVRDEKEVLSAERITQGLSIIWSLILQRPPVRETCLRIALQCAVHEHEAVRTKAIRLVANKLYPLSYVAPKIEAFAADMLLSVVDQREVPGKVQDSMDVDASTVVQDMETKKVSDQVNGVEGKQGEVVGSVVADEMTGGDDGQRSKSNPAVTMAEAQRCMSLFFALCTKKHALLGQVFSVYGRASKEFKQAVKQRMPLVVRSIGASSPELLNLIANPPPGSSNLLLGVLHSISEGGTMSHELISTVKQLYEKLHDASFLIPILSSFSKEEVLPIFPRLVELPPETFQSSLDRILQGSAHSGPAMTPAEVLLALHDIDPRRDAVPLKKITDACSACLQQRTVFTQQVLARVLNQMVEQTPLPLLFMRTVIQAVGAFPSLVDFVMEILSRLVNKQIWKTPKLWVGFLKCANQTMPHSFHVLLQLPALQLEDALNKQPTLRAPLAAHAMKPNIRANVPRSSLVLLGIVQDGPAPDSVAPSATPQAEIPTT